MTAHQIQRLQQIRGECVTILSQAQNRSPGKWHNEGRGVWFHQTPHRMAVVCEFVHPHDGKFIASASRALESSLRSTIAAIDKALDIQPSDDLAEAIIAAWQQ